MQFNPAITCTERASGLLVTQPKSRAKRLCTLCMQFTVGKVLTAQQFLSLADRHEGSGLLSLQAAI